ncbi:MAG: DNA recombination protein RmuC [Chromatiales bacterium]|nr:DNA recombination protein RmuC [Chromatiales bacterium]
MTDIQTIGIALVAFGIGAVIGILGYVVLRRGKQAALETELAMAQAELKSQLALTEERQQTMQQAETRLATVFTELASKQFTNHSENFLRLAKQSLGKHRERAKSDLSEKEQAIEQLVKPIRDALEKTHKQISEIEKTRHEAFGGIREQLKFMAEGQEALQGETRNLVSALRRPEVRGQWGELTLRRVVELAGMVSHCDFIEQVHTETEGGPVRPDMIVRLPEQGTIIIDAKTPLDAYLTAVEAADDQAKKVALQRHARKVAERVRELASKAYWAQFEHSPQFVVLFIPGDQFLSAAMDENPTLMEEALRQQIIIATPSNLIALLKTVAYQWRQDQLAENAEQIKRLAQDLHDRLGTFTGHLARVGKQLEGSVKAYNSAVGSMERKVLPGARKFVELGIQEKDEIAMPNEIETTTREIEDLSDDKPPEQPAITAIDIKSEADQDDSDDPTHPH